MSWVMVAVGGMTAFNQVQQGRTARQQGNMQAQASEFQARIEQENALKTAEIIRRAGRRQVGQASAAYAAAGVKVGEGSALETERQINLDVEHDAFQSLLEGGRRARGLQTDAEMARAQGRMAQAAGYVNAMGTVLSTGYSALRANGWRSNGPGFSGTRAPAPVEDRSFRIDSRSGRGWMDY